jgi:hypothetical protein
MTEEIRPSGPDRGPLSRREFVKAVGATALVASAPRVGDRAETAVARFYRSLTDGQRARICFPCDHPHRLQVQNNWAIVPERIADLTAEQRALCDEVLRGLCCEDGYDRFARLMEEDGGGFDRYHVAVFGEPGAGGPFEWVLTGRHATLRADGNAATGASFAGPIFYGHAAKSGNVWGYLGQRASAIFESLDESRRARALVVEATPGRPRPTRGATGLSAADLDGPRKAMVHQLLADLLRPFRGYDAGGVRECLRDSDALRLTLYQRGDIWRLECPAFAWSFHGSPHVHAWLDVARTP